MTADRRCPWTHPLARTANISMATTFVVIVQETGYIFRGVPRRPAQRSRHRPLITDRAHAHQGRDLDGDGHVTVHLVRPAREGDVDHRGQPADCCGQPLGINRADLLTRYRLIEPEEVTSLAE